MKKRIFILLLLSCGLANAQFMSGNQLKDHCNKADNLVSAGLCMGYVEGVADANSFLFCTPPGVTVGQIRDVVKKYLNDNPAQLHKPGDDLATEALRSAFPCAKRK